MHCLTPLNAFVRQYAAVVLASLAPVVLLAFVSMPLSLGRHPGEGAVNVPWVSATMRPLTP